MLVLVDQDQVIADFEGRWGELWRDLHPEGPFVEPADRTSLHLTADYPAEWHERVEAVRNTPGFIRSLTPIEGAIEGMHALREAGHDVFICTSPLTEYTHCVLEKHQWVEERLGLDWVRRVILTKDKTLIRGDVLIDDNPRITGLMTPQWTHVLFTQAYNRHLPGPRLTWADAPQVLADLEEQLATR